MIARRILAVVALTCVLFSSSSAYGWHHWRGFYGVGPAYSWGGVYRHHWRPFHSFYSYRPLYHRPWIGYRPHVYHRPLYYSSYYVSPIYTTPIYMAPIYTTPIYTTPIYSAPIVPSCDPCEIPVCSSTPTYQDSIVDPQLQIQYSSSPTYQVASRSNWVDKAVDLIDDMVATGGYVEAEDACLQLIAVKNDLPADVYLRAGLLALQNGKSIESAADHFDHVQSLIGDRSMNDLLSKSFISSMQLQDNDALESHIQVASKSLLEDVSSAAKVTRFVSEDSNSVRVMKPAVQTNSDAFVVLETLLKVKGQDQLATAIKSKLEGSL
jgi:hypothetical protein